MERSSKSSVALRIAALFALAVSACGTEVEPVAPEAPASADLAAPASVMPDASVAPLFVLAEFEGSFDGATGTFTIEQVESEAAAEGLRSIQQALYCAQRVANDGNPNTNPPGTIELYTDPATISASAIGSTPHPYCVANATGGQPIMGSLFSVFGVFCADVRVSNYYADLLTDVYVAVDVLAEGDETEYAPYAEGLGTSAVAPSGLTAATVGLPALDGLWSYGNLTPRPAAGSQRSVVWAFRYARPDGFFRFRGRVVARGPTEVCGNAVDEDCDGRLNNGCGLYAVGEACLANNDCTTAYCNAGFCDGNPCTDGVRGGDESDIDCGGSICGANCVAGDLCNTNADCGSGVCRLVSVGASTARVCGAGPIPTPGEVRISEIAAGPIASSSSGEWVELTNVSSSTLDLAGCFLDDATLGSTDYTPLTPASGTLAIAPGGRLLLASPTPGATVFPTPPDYIWTSPGLALNNGGQTLALYCGTIAAPLFVDEVTYTSGEVAANTTIQVDPAVLGLGAGGTLSGDRCVTPASVPEFSGTLRGTPGTANADCSGPLAIGICRVVAPTPGTQLPEGSSLLSQAYVSVTNLTGRTAGADPSVRLSVQAAFGPRGTNPATAPGWSVWASAVAGSATGEGEFDRYTYSFTPPGGAGTQYDMAFRVSLDGASPVYCDVNAGPGSDGSEDGYQTANASQFTMIAPAREPVPGDLVITEVMARPASGSTTESNSEWFEVYNRSSDVIQLGGCRITDAQYNPSTASTYHVISGNFVVPPGEYAVLARTSGIAMPAGVTPYYWDAGNTGLNPQLANASDAVALRCGATYDLIDEVVWGSPASYPAGWASVPPTGTSDPGRSTQLVPTRASLVPANNVVGYWCNVPSGAATQYATTSTSVPVYGTPGAANPACASVDYCRLQFPESLPDVAPGSSVEVFARLYTAGLTDVTPYTNDFARTLVAEVGIGPAGSNPTTDLAGWTFSSATPNALYSIASPGAEQNNDEYVGTITVPSANNEAFAYTVRFSPDGGTTWSRYCDRTVLGSDATVDGYQVANSGIGDVAPPAPSPTYCRVDPGSIAADGGTSVTAAAFVYVPGLTDISNANNPSASLAAQIGFGPSGANASTNPELFNFADATPSPGYFGGGGDFNNDRYERSFTMPSANTGTTRSLVARFSSNGGASWLYCDAAGSNPYTPASNGTLTSNVWTPYWAFLQWPRSHSGNAGSTVTWFAQMWAPGLTDRQYASADPTPDFVVQIGYGPQGTDPALWPEANWSATVTNGAAGGFSSDDEYMVVNWPLPAAGNYSVDVRISPVGGGSWLYGSWHNGVNLNGPFNASLLASLTSISTAPQLIFSEYLEGSSNSKALEIANLGGSAVDLSACAITHYNNGASETVGTRYTLSLPSVSLAAGDVWSLCNGSSAAGLLSQCDFTTTNAVMTFNGDDAIVLRCGGQVIDSIGQVGFDPGAAWGAGTTPVDSIRTVDRTIRRVCGASADTVVDDAYAPHTSGQWIGFAIDTFGGIGSRACPGTP